MIEIYDPQKLPGGKTKQEVVLADETATASLILWEDDINLLVKNKSYQMFRLAVRIYMGKKQLSVPSSGVTIDEIEDIPNVSKPEPSSDDEETCTAVTIAGIQQLEANTACINCKKLIPATSESVCVCNTILTTDTQQNYS